VRRALPFVVAVAGVCVRLLGACGGQEFVAGGGAADASPDVAPSPGFCALEAGNATFCDDFDGPPLTAPNRWSTIDQSSGAVVQIVTAPSPFFSAPASLDSQTPLSLGLGAQRGRVEKTFDSASHVVTSFQLHLDAVGDKPQAGNGGESFVALELASLTVGLSANTNQVTYFEDITADGGVPVSNVVVATGTIKGSWVPVTFDVDLAHATLDVNVNGTAVGPIQLQVPTGSLGVAQLYFGWQSRNIDQALEAHFDDVVVNVTP
jgi:hypothetical protein